MHTPEFDFEALVRSMGMADINAAVQAAAKKVAEEQEAARKAAEEAERKRREAEAAAAAAIAAEKKREAEATHKVQRITAIANAALMDSLTADDVAFILRQYAHAKHPDFPLIDLEAIFDADTIESYIDTAIGVFSHMKFLLPSGAKQAPGKNNLDEIFKQIFSDPVPEKTDDEVLRSFVNRILK